MSQKLGFSSAVFKSPLLWGAIASIVFYGLVDAGVLATPLIHQYFASHPVEYVTTVLFFIGMAALGIKWFDVSGQFQALGRRLLPAGEVAADAARRAEELLEQLDRQPRRRWADYLVGRLRGALGYVRRCGSAEGLDEELRYLAEVDVQRAHASYGLVRMIVWAIPILGFLGTVIGIALAIGKLSPQALEQSLPQVMAGLTVAFNTTALALGLSMVLMFGLFLTERRENMLLAEVDRRVEAEMSACMPRRAKPETAVEDVRRMGEAVIAAAEQLVQRQSRLWEATIRAAENRWLHMANEAGKQLQSTLATALAKSISQHAEQLAAHEHLYAERSGRQWKEVTESLAAHTQTLAELHATVTRQVELLERLGGATAQITQLEAALNRNLAALAGSHNFEQTVMSLAAAIHLLNSRLTQASDLSPVRLESPAAGHAA